jgi:hypothetical protein
MLSFPYEASLSSLAKMLISLSLVVDYHRHHVRFADGVKVGVLFSETFYRSINGVVWNRMLMSSSSYLRAIRPNAQVMNHAVSGGAMQMFDHAAVRFRTPENWQRCSVHEFIH